jgi:hypothetical protein
MTPSAPQRAIAPYLNHTGGSIVLKYRCIFFVAIEIFLIDSIKFFLLSHGHGPHAVALHGRGRLYHLASSWESAAGCG